MGIVRTYRFQNLCNRLIRLSSPKLNNVTVFGAITLYVSAVLFAIPTRDKSVVKGLCIARLWFLYLGMSLAFGTVIMKMIRIYIIFSNPSPKRKKVSLMLYLTTEIMFCMQLIQDWMLAVGVLILVIIDLVVLIVYTIIVLGLNLEIVERATHRENPQAIEGVSIAKHGAQPI